MSKKWLQFVAASRKNFDVNNAITVYICDGHSRDDDFYKSQLMMYKCGARKKAPMLNSTAVPIVVNLQAPHFVKRAQDPDLRGLENNPPLQPVPIDPICTTEDEPQKKRPTSCGPRLRNSSKLKSTSTSGFTDWNL